MAKITIKHLQSEIDTLRELRKHDEYERKKWNEQIHKQAESITTLERIISDLKSQVQWHRQMNQSLVEKIPGARH